MRTAIALTHITLLSFATLTGCLSHTRDDADAGRDAAFVPSDVCACVDGPRTMCEGMSAVGVGGCDAELGYRWDGATCQLINGCSCEGADCAELAPSETVCLERHRSCSRACGTSFGGPLPACLSGEYCDYPVCGGDDGVGTCTEAPDVCGGPVCGCDGTTYATVCEAATRGASVARHTACDAPSYRFAQMRASCAPTDGPAWAFTLTSSALACEPAPSGERLEFEIWTELNTAPAEMRYFIAAPFGGQGVARLCPSGGAPCVDATGSVTVHGFAAGEVTRFDYDLTTTDGRHLIETNVEGTNWCLLVGTGCG